MTGSAGSNSYQHGLELAETGQYEAALGCIREHLRSRPHDAQALNDAGAILHCLGRSDDAIEYLTKAWGLQPDSGEIVWNLMEAYLAADLASEAVFLVDKMEGMGILTVDVMNRLATRLLNQGKKGQAADILLRSHDLWPSQEILKPILEVIRSKRPRVAFFSNGPGEEGPLAEVCAFVQQRFRTEFHDAREADGVELVQSSDIVWFDGGGEMVVDASRRPHGGKVVASLRCSDVNAEWVKDVQWENIDIVVQIGSSAVEETLRKWVPNIRNRTRLATIPHGINTDRYPLQRRPKGKHLACMSELCDEANPGFLLQCMQKLCYIDAGYRLFFSGRFQSPILEQYIRHMVWGLGLADVVVFEPYPSDVNAWLCDKHFIVSSGLDERQVEVLLTGMASGLRPIVHSFPGADRVFPPEHLFRIAEEFCQQVLADDYEPQTYRRFVEDRYPIREQLKSVNDILGQLESEIEGQVVGETRQGTRRDACVPIRAFEKSRPAGAMAANA